MIDYLGQRLRQARSEAGLSQVQIAAACNVSQPTISYWERPTGANHYNELGLASLMTIARITGKPVAWFLEEHPKPTYAETELASESICITAEAVEAESVHANQLGILTLGPNGEEYRELLVDSYRLHWALGIQTPYQEWLDHVRNTYPFIAQHCELVFNGQASNLYWYMETAKAIALLTGSARGFAIWQKLVGLSQLYGRPVVQPESPAPQASAIELKVPPKEFIDVVSGCVKLAHQMGLHGERAQQAADQAATRLTGWSVRELLGIAA
jgi:transcriptional regulator with XRE-family HTH domain